MPRLQDIEWLKRDLAALSREEEILAQWGEAPEGAPPPGGAAEAGSEAMPEEGLPPDFAALLEALPLESGEQDGTGGSSFDSMGAELEALLAPSSAEESAEEAAPETPAIPEEAAEFELPAAPEEASEFELPAIPEETEEAGPEEAAEPEMPAAPAEAEEAAPAEAEEAAPETPSGLEDFSFPDLDEAFSIPEIAAEGPSQAAEEAAEGAEPAEGELVPVEELAAPEEAALSSPGEALPADESFALPDSDELFGGPGIPSEPLAGTSADEAFSIPEMGDFGESAPSAPGEPSAQEEPSALAEAPAADDFSIPDFGLEEPGAETAEAAEAPPAGGEEGFSLGEGLELGAPEAGAAEPGAGEALKAEEAMPAADDFESFSFEEPGPSAAGGFGAQEGFGAEGGLGAGFGSTLDSELASLGEAAPAADTFSIDREWGGFGAAGAEEEPPRQIPPRPSSRSTAEEKYKAVSLSEAQVDRLQDSLLAYPLNLRVAIEDILANEKGSMAQRSKLVWAMVEGSSAEEASGLASRVLKRRIEIPKGFEKRTGAAFEAEKGSLGYAFIHTVLPVLRVVLLAAAMASALGWLGYRYIYKALAANAAYRAGYQRIAESRFPEAEASFEKARGYKEYDAWYYRYAEAYVAKRQYLLAERKYAALVDRRPKERKAILDWARLEKDQLKFEEAVKVLKGTDARRGGEATRGMTGLLSWDYGNKDGLLLLGDIYLDWAEEDPKWYEEARRSYASLIERYGQLDLYMGRMLLYFIRTDNIKEVAPLVARYVADRSPEERAKIPFDARTLAELGGYLLDRGQLEEVRAILMAAATKDPALPEAHYHIARYFSRAGDHAEERKALDNAIRTFASLPGLGAKREALYIDSLVWRANYRLAAGEWLSAEQDFAAAAAEYERGLELRRIKRSPRFAEAYAGLGEVAYWQRLDLPAALGHFERAAADGYDTPGTRYKRAYILYRSGRIADSLLLFHRAGLEGAASPYLDYAFGAALYARGDYFAAEACFKRVVDRMNDELRTIAHPAPQRSASQGEIVELLMKGQNNLGAAIYKAAARIGDPRRRSSAMAAFAESTRLFDSLTRDQETLARAESKNLGFLNMDYILHPQRGMEVAIYAEIERDMDFPRRR